MPTQIASAIFLPTPPGQTPLPQDPEYSLKGTLIFKDGVRFIEFLKTGQVDAKQHFVFDKEDVYVSTFFEYWAEDLNVLKALREAKAPFPSHRKDHDDFLWAVMKSPHFKETLSWLQEEGFHFQLNSESLLHALIERDEGRSRWVDVGKALLELGVDPNMKDSEEYSAIMVAAMYDHVQWATLLLEHQADWKAIHPIELKNAMEMSKDGTVAALFLDRQMPEAKSTSKTSLRL